ncbi:MAG: hypothetical protein QOG53_159 [Frankiales bacterium]|jgi:hypothetical protein|nr:hypothetical protein [Frankiales bacterium]
MFDNQVTPDAQPVETLGAPDPFDDQDFINSLHWHELEECFGPDPDGATRPLSAAETLAWVEQTPVGPDAARSLFEIDPTQLDEDQHLRLAKQCQRFEAAAAARKLQAIVAFAGEKPDPLDPTAGGLEPDFTDCAVAAELTLSQPAAARLVTTARRLLRSLPRTFSALTDGRLGYLSVLRIVEASAELSDDACVRYEELVLPKAETLTPGQVNYLAHKAAARVDAEAAARRQQRARRMRFADVVPATDSTSYVNGHGPVEDAAMIDNWLESYARAAKAGGDERTINELRWAGLVNGAVRYLTGATDSPAHPTQHGRPVEIHVAVDLTTFLGLTNHPMELLGTGQLIPAEALPDLLPNAKIRRVITDPMSGHLLDYGRTTYRIPADLAGHVIATSVTSSGPGSTVPATRADIDHGLAFDDGGNTNRDNLHPTNRRWHRAKTLGGWTVVQNDDRTWTWTSPQGHTTTTEPHDYRLGP